MNKQQLLKMAKDIQRSGLSENKIAKELVNEINDYLKSSSTSKRALFDIDGVGNPSLYRDYFFYWALASLSQLKKAGAVDLMSIDIPQPTKGQSATDYVKSVKGSNAGEENSMPSFMRRRRRRGANPIEGILDTIWGAGEKNFKKQFIGVPNAFISAYRGRMEMAEYAVRKSGDWAFAMNGHNMTTTDSGIESSRTKVWDSIQESTKDTGNLVQDVLNAIELGVWDKVFNPLSWKKTTTGIKPVELDGKEKGEERSRYDRLDMSTPSYEDELIEQIDKDRAKQEEIIDEIMVKNPDLNWFEAEAFAKKLAEEAKKAAENAVNVSDIDDPEVQSALENIKALNLEIGALKEMSDLLKDEKFHWLFDSHIYLEQWDDFYTNFDAEAMAKLDALIRSSGQKTLPVALRALVTINSTDKLQALSHFIENCMDKSLVKSLLTGKPGVAYLIWLCIRAKGGFKFKSSGRPRTIPADTSNAFPTQKFWGDVRPLFMGMTEEEKSIFSSDMKAMLNDLAPMSLLKAKTVQSTIDYMLKIFTKELKDRKKDDIPELYKSKAKVFAGPKGLFYSTVATEIIRYRYYMDLELSDLSSDPLVPDTLGNSKCDDSVRLLIPQLPDQILNTLKQQVVESETLPSWAETVSDALEKQAQESEKLKNNLTANARKLIEALKANDKGAEKKARLRVAYLMFKNR